MSRIPLPTEIEAYFQALRKQDAKAVALCFQEQASVRDEGKKHIGQVAIQRWMEEALHKYGFTADPLSARTEGLRWEVRALVSGQFPGSPIELKHLFHVEDGKLASLEVVSA